MKTIYILLTRTDTVFSKVITRFSHEPFAHTSLLFDENFASGYSFSRKKLNNPFIGGLVCEDYPKWTGAFPNTFCRVYKLHTTDEKFEHLQQILEKWFAQQDIYGYNLRGVVGRLFNIDLEPKNKFFCTQFISTVLMEADILHFDTPPIQVIVRDFKNHPDLTLIYEGYLTSLLQEGIQDVVPLAASY
ncbi:MAG: hypothetical protein ATN36_08030 [Epulopiscium sp. Nele67-Bin005]|nr:MAG: hypothetical protein ATN36_08030 [Epulopiscium sp. Nele67-Bin005]